MTLAADAWIKKTPKNKLRLKLKEKEIQNEKEQSEGNDGRRKEEAVCTHTSLDVQLKMCQKTAGFTLSQTVK